MMQSPFRFFGDCSGNINGMSIIQNMERKMNDKFKDLEVCKVHDTNGDASHVVI